MAEHPNATLIREAGKAMEGDAEASMAMLADEVVWHEIGRDEPIRGKRALAERINQFFGGI